MEVYKEIVQDQYITLSQFREMYRGTLSDIKKKGTKITPKIKKYTFYIAYLYFYYYYGDHSPSGSVVSDESVGRVLGKTLTEEDLASLSELCNSTFNFLYIPSKLHEHYYKSSLGNWQSSKLGVALHEMEGSQYDLYVKYLKGLAITIQQGMDETTRHLVLRVALLTGYCLDTIYRPVDSIEIGFNGDKNWLILNMESNVEHLHCTSTENDKSGIRVQLANIYTLTWEDYGVFSNLPELKKLLPEVPESLIETYLYKPAKDTVSDQNL